ncbi:hypothetical protein [Persicobacter diffluens]|uniref:Uncharacterized protein n=1 Tax=Persicobacter diffluens TaxID=981 RepID=A0AAN4VYG6_9BACT|nr:hypothetical protein PEDI_19330 [Persicobacter diffluens]
MDKKYIYKTKNFTKPWTWVKRFFYTILIWAWVLNLNLESEYDTPVIVVLIVATFIAFSLPEEDIGITGRHFIHFESSLFPLFSKTTYIEIKQINSIRCAGIHSGTWAIIDLFNGFGNNGGRSNPLEITYKQSESVSYDLKINRKELNQIVTLVNKIRKHQLQIKEEVKPI